MLSKYFSLTASFLVAVVRAVITPVTHLAQGDTVTILTFELPRGAGGCWRVAHVLQLIGLIPAVVVAVADKVTWHTAAVLAGELMLLARLVRAALLIAAVSTVVTAVAPDLKSKENELKFPVRLITDDIPAFLLTCKSCVCRDHYYRWTRWCRRTCACSFDAHLKHPHSPHRHHTPSHGECISSEVACCSHMWTLHLNTFDWLKKTNKTGRGFTRS